MKLKLFIVFLVAVLAVVGYKTSKETKALKSINSYESCTTSKGSVIQESYPAICTTTLGDKFSEPTSQPVDFPQKQVTSYTSQYAKITLTFPKPLFVKEVYQSEGNQAGNEIDISLEDSNVDSPNGLHIIYGIPYIEGKGGACLDKNGNGAWIKKTILNQVVDLCDQPGFYSAGYPSHPNGNIEYWFTFYDPDQSNIKMFKDIIDSAKFTN